MVQITSELIKTDVTSIKYFENSIYAGIGGNLHVFNLEGILRHVYKVFSSQRIYDIVPYNKNKLALFGGYHLKTVEIDKSQVTRIIDSRLCDDWILAVQWLNDHIALAFANNYISVISSNLKRTIKSVKCQQRCIIYSAHLINNTFEDLFVFSGTVFREILIWKPHDSGNVYHRLKGHDVNITICLGNTAKVKLFMLALAQGSEMIKSGVIFSINYSKEHNLIVSTSDDRTLRLWTNSDPIFNDNQTIKVTASQKKIIYGHTARVFRSKITKNSIITSGEDPFIYIWNLDGSLKRKIETQSGCLWSLECINEDKLVVGSGDSGISIFPLNINSESRVLLASEATPRTIKIMKSGNSVIITDKGTLKYLKDDKWEDVSQHDDLKSYAVLEVSICRRFLALGGFNGSLYIYEEKDDLQKIYSVNNLTNSRIYSIHFLNEKTILTSEENGILQIWSLEQNILPKIQLTLPPSKERWCTKATFCGNNHLAVGDRKGNVYLYKLNEENPLQIIKKAQTHLGITHLYFHNNQLICLGRSGIIKKYNFDGDKLHHNSSDKLPFSWLASITENKILGFSGSHFIIWDQLNRRILHEIDCGGGHRSWDFYILDNLVNFIYIKEKNVVCFRCKWTDIETINIIPGFHNKEINTLKIIQAQKNSDNFFIVSGGEDTTVRLSSVQSGVFEPVLVLKSHLSSVRAVKIYKIDDSSYVMISAGGRSQIILWRVSITNNEVHCDEMDNFYKNPVDDDIETRIMDIEIYKNERNILTVVAACSDGTIKIFNISENLEKLNFICTVTYALKCIIKIAYLKYSNCDVVISMATDGKLVFWNFTNVCDEYQNLKPILVLPNHQSGINSFHYHKISEHSYAFITGGDDNAVIINSMEFNFNHALSLKHLLKWKCTDAHGAQITGVFLMENYFITTSIDQYISVFSYNSELNCKFLKNYCSVIADVQGVDCLEVKDILYLYIFGKGIEIVKISVKK